jgi:hypothetical protein
MRSDQDELPATYAIGPVSNRRLDPDATPVNAVSGLAVSIRA